MTDLHIEYIPTSELQKYERNARKHAHEDVETIKNSIKEFGFNDPIGIWSEKKIIVEGHGRLMAAQELGIDEVPCIRLDHLTDEQRRAYALAHNKTAEMSDWDFDFLDLEIEDITDIDMAQFGFDITKIDGFGEDFTLPDGEKSDICQITFYLHENQKELIEYAMSVIGDDFTETFGNKNKHGNQIYEVVRQWAEQRT